MTRSSRKKSAPAPVVKKERNFQPQVFRGQVAETTDSSVYIEFGPLGRLRLPRANAPTKYARGQTVEIQVAIVGNDPLGTEVPFV